MANDEIIKGASHRTSSRAARELSAVIWRYDFDMATAVIV